MSTAATLGIGGVDELGQLGIWRRDILRFDFTGSGVTYLAATGDDGNPGEYPAFSPNVVAVGGTDLHSLQQRFASYLYLRLRNRLERQRRRRQHARIRAELSRRRPVERTPRDSRRGRRMRASGSGSTTRTTTPTVAAPGSVSGGTSLATPIWAGLIAIADQGRVAAGEPP